MFNIEVIRGAAGYGSERLQAVRQADLYWTVTTRTNVNDDNQIERTVSTKDPVNLLMQWLDFPNARMSARLHSLDLWYQAGVMKSFCLDTGTFKHTVFTREELVTVLGLILSPAVKIIDRTTADLVKKIIS